MAKRRLSQRQKERIQAIQERRRQKIALRAETALLGSDESPPEEGLVITRHGRNLELETQQGERVQALFRQNIGHVVCGDRVVWQRTSDKQGVVTAILPRISLLSRPNFSGKEKPLAANITQLVVVIAPEPTPSTYLVDQYLAATELIGVAAVIALNKSDLLTTKNEAWFDGHFGHYPTIGYPIIQISARYEHGLTPLTEAMRDETSILVGQSGVGKSSLTNALLPESKIDTQQLSEASGQGRHTTSATTLYHLPSGGRLIDSPGVRSFRLGDITKIQLEQGFREFAPFIGHCQFSNCTHQQEPNCAIREAVDENKIPHNRMNNFLHMVEGLNKSV